MNKNYDPHDSHSRCTCMLMYKRFQRYSIHNIFFCIEFSCMCTLLGSIFLKSLTWCLVLLLWLNPDVLQCCSKNSKRIRKYIACLWRSISNTFWDTLFFYMYSQFSSSWNPEFRFSGSHLRQFNFSACFLFRLLENPTHWNARSSRGHLGSSKNGWEYSWLFQ